LSRFNWAIFLGLVCCLPALVFGQSEPSKHLYAVEYSYEEGITLHRFLHHKWNVFRGGGSQVMKVVRVAIHPSLLTSIFLASIWTRMKNIQSPVTRCILGLVDLFFVKAILG